MITSEDQMILDEFEAAVTAEYEQVSVTKGDKHSYLGRLFDFSEKFKCKISMSGFLECLLSDEDVDGSAATPATERLFKTRQDAQKLCADKKARFYSVVQRLLYLSVQFRRDICVAVSFLTTRVRDPDDDDWKKLRRVLMYLNGTRELCLVFSGDGSKEFSLYVSIDAAFGLHPDGKSHSGYVAMIAGGSVEAKSKKQSLVTKSSTRLPCQG
jgi:hypothetical protein